MKAFKFPLVWATFSLILAGFVGNQYFGGFKGIGQAVLITAVLGILEVSLSFDNAVVNAKILETVDPVWQTRFLRWGVPIAVVGMRVVFPLVVIGFTAWISPVDAINIAVFYPDKYAAILSQARPEIMAFGGTFLGMVGLKFMFDAEKDLHWISFIERHLQRFGKMESAEAIVVLLLLFITAKFAPDTVNQGSFYAAGIMGLITYIAVDGLGDLMSAPEETTAMVAKSGLSAFIYLEVMDASFSFDGVIGAFALSTNLFIIALGLGIGATCVRALTLVLVKKKVLTQYRYLEHGAFWAVLALYVSMLISVRVEIPEVITGLMGAAFIAAAWWSSVCWNKKHAIQPSCI